MSTTSNNQSLVISYLALRKTIGFLGLLLPFILMIGGWIASGSFDVEPSISDYYYTKLGSVFVGTLSVVAMFLFAYKGYETADRIAGFLGCVFALGVVFFPTAPCPEPEGYQKIFGYLHFAFAGLFFTVLIFFSLVLFTKSSTSHRMTGRKKMRNTVYHVCGYIMIACILGIAVFSIWFDPEDCKVEDGDVTFWLETIALMAFGASWLVKGELILKDLNTPQQSEDEERNY